MKSLYKVICATTTLMFIVYATSYPNPSIADFAVRFLHTIDLWSLFALPIFILGTEIIESNVRLEG